MGEVKLGWMEKRVLRSVAYLDQRQGARGVWFAQVVRVSGRGRKTVADVLEALDGKGLVRVSREESERGRVRLTQEGRAWIESERTARKTGMMR